MSIIISKIVGTTFLKLSEGESINTITYEEKGSATVKEKLDRKSFLIDMISIIPILCRGRRDGEEKDFLIMHKNGRRYEHV